MKWIAHVLLAGVALGVFGSQASATPIVFDVTGTFSDGSSLDGTITLDPTTGDVSAVDLIVGVPWSLEFDVVQSQTHGGPVVPTLETGLTASGRPTLGLLFATTSFVNYAGGQLCSTSVTTTDCGKHGSSELLMADSSQDRFLATGSVTPAVPEPASLILFGTGLCALAASGRRRAQA
jgi:PEP-CTERM motif